MTDARAFRGFRFPAEVILWAVRWYLQFPISYRDLEAMLADRGVEVDHVSPSAGFSASHLSSRSAYADISGPAAVDFTPESGGVGSERHAAASMVIPSMLALASAGVR
jgi:hypothetical protein